MFILQKDPTNPERLYIGAGIWNDDSILGGHMKPAVLALETSTGTISFWVLSQR